MHGETEKSFVQREYIKEWEKANYESIRTVFPKKLEIGKTLDIASQKAGISKREYVRRAIIRQLKMDGFNVEIKTKQNYK